jgi:GTP cyclohydrolase IA
MYDHELERAYREILGATPGEDCGREGLQETPERAMKAWRELTSGYDVDVAALLKTFDSDGYDEMVAVTQIPFASLCEHHLLPFTGLASVVYIPDGRIVGLSKIPRLVDAFSHRLQVQERMTVQIADALVEHLHPVGVMVVLEATHTCATLRGVKKAGTLMRTSVVRGALSEKPAARAEALALIR